MLGRFIVAEDEQPGARQVVVIGHDVGSLASPRILRSSARHRLGNDVHTVVGVMPDGFKFPVNHSYWCRWHRSRRSARPGSGGVRFGRLARGAEITDAQAEVTIIGDRASAQFPDTHATPEPRVMPYAHRSWTSRVTAWWFVSVQATMSLLLVIVSSAWPSCMRRTATRHGGSLYAQRLAPPPHRRSAVHRILVLSAVAAGVGLLLTQYGLRMGQQIMQLEGESAILYGSRTASGAGYLYVAAVTIGSAVISECCLRCGNRAPGATLRSWGSSGMRLGPTGGLTSRRWRSPWRACRWRSRGMGEGRGNQTTSLAAEQFLVAPFRLDPEPPAASTAEYRRDLATRFEKLGTDFRRSSAEPEVSDVTTATMIRQ